jgi:hypothetical protein
MKISPSARALRRFPDMNLNASDGDRIRHAAMSRLQGGR